VTVVSGTREAAEKIAAQRIRAAPNPVVGRYEDCGCR
jgi:hypothetical protein